MKIILATSMGGLGGTETASLRLGSLLARHGHDVLLAASDGPLVSDAQAAGMRWQNIDFYGGGRTGYLRAALSFARLLRRERPDIVHCQMARIVPACAIAAKICSPRSKVFYHARGLNPETYPKIARLFAKLGVYIIANCRHEQQKLIRHGFPAGRTAYTYNALPPALAVSAKTPRGFVMLGTLSRLDKVRAVHLTIDVFHTLLQRGLPVRLHIAGTGEERPALEAQAGRLGIADKVSFLGAVRDLNAYFADTDILVNTLDCAGDHGAGVTAPPSPATTRRALPKWWKTAKPVSAPRCTTKPHWPTRWSNSSARPNCGKPSATPCTNALPACVRTTKSTARPWPPTHCKAV